MPRKRTAPLAEHFWSKVDKTGNRCWLWTATRRPKGYGTYYIDRYPALAHRVAWELTFGPIPDGMQVLHRCDNPPCVRPDHLFIGSPADNMHDAQRKGRMPINPRPHRGRVRGERHPSARLTERDVTEIRRRATAGEVSPTAIGREYGVSGQSIDAVIKHKTWKHLP